MNEPITVRVMIVDDEPGSAESLRSILLLNRSAREYRFAVEILTDPDDPAFLNQLEAFEPHVVLLDIRFGDQTRFGLEELLPKLRGLLEDKARIIMVTAHRGADTAQIIEALGWDASAFLDKRGIESVLVPKVTEAYRSLFPSDGEGA
ncbi:MAG TPA: response regulator [Acidobacteria bacterium]|nr:response regulator [Acidobacteriota bacterium]